ncbi:MULTISPECIES: glycosyltransferase [unclassified Pseudomonas]|uniref:glycosyltransferase n=1 Tax=unclassified Pseudomonas TaxID=196821 RepID=UPI0024473464|nr:MULTISPECIES: glycosyltransferase [unclassified Pseudomonas]MDG9925186.1 glycosyltransferase [Pseudomonas sp. GD04045]MDH0035316.1 glycosyltransferase [Pseudomonas sp. GD04019]
MRILVYSETSASNLQSRLGTSEYSYYFVLREFLPVLRALGEVQVMENPQDEVDPIYLECRAKGEACVFLSFSPPHRTLLNLQCPTIPVFAWEFDSIPNEAWLGRPEEDWSWVLRQLGFAVTHSVSTIDAAYKVLESSYRLLNAPAPVWDAFAGLRELPRQQGPWLIRGQGALFDSRVLDLPSFLDAKPDYWHSQVHGTSMPKAELEAEERRRVELEVVHRRFGEGASYEATAALNIHNPPRRLLDRSWWQISKRYAVTWYTSVLADMLPRTAQSLKSGRPISDGNVPAALFQAAPFELVVEGVVFTSVFNPYDGRKNWQDLLSAFCNAFAERDDAVLLFKLTHRACTSPIVDMLRYLARLPAFRCRVILLHGYLDDADYQALVGATAYVVNASYGEGQCLPLMEFLSCGKPAIAPDHSGMMDYIDNQMAFVVESWDEATGWPHDPRFATRTHRKQISWTSLREAFVEAYTIYHEYPERYAAMSEYAIERMRQHCSRDVLAVKLRPFLEAASCV